MKFLIDECLHRSLLDVAAARGHDADFVPWIGKGGWQDWNLMPVILAEAYTFVTENRADFLRLFSVEQAHAGLVVFMRKAEPSVQCELFGVVLDELEQRPDLFNQVIMVEFDGSQAAATGIRFERTDLSRPD